MAERVVLNSPAGSSKQILQSVHTRSRETEIPIRTAFSYVFCSCAALCPERLPSSTHAPAIRRAARLSLRRSCSTATASPCSSQPIASMGYSLDGSTSTSVVNSTSINAQVSAPAGAHTLHVKSWGNQGASCVADVPITIAAAAPASAPAAPAASTTPSVTVSSPASGASVSTPFPLYCHCGAVLVAAGCIDGLLVRQQH